MNFIIIIFLVMNFNKRIIKNAKKKLKIKENVSSWYILVYYKKKLQKFPDGKDFEKLKRELTSTRWQTLQNTVYVKIFKIKMFLYVFKTSTEGSSPQVYIRKINTKRKEQEGNSNGMFLVSAIPIV